MKPGKNFSIAGKISRLLGGNPLKPVSLAGIAISLLLVWALLYCFIVRDERIFPSGPEYSPQIFRSNLQRFDSALVYEKPEQLAQRLDRLEQLAKNQDEWLSILKRRRNLARRNPDALLEYQKSAEAAFGLFPQSEVMAAVAGESIVQRQITEEKADALLKYADSISQTRFFPLALGFYVLGGALENPAKAAEIEEIELLLNSDLSSELKQMLQIDSILLGIPGGRRNSAVQINEMIRQADAANSNSRTDKNFAGLLRLGGEYFYDHGSPLRSAELFSRLGEDYSIRAAEALALAGNIPAARNIWTALAGTTTNTSANSAGGNPGNSREDLARKRSLYNLAATSTVNAEAAAWLEKIFSPGNQSGADILNIYAVIRFSRLQNVSRGIAILENEAYSKSAIVDLELMRRRLEILPPDRAAAEVWLMLGRRPESEELYQWASWYFDRQKLYTETAQALKIAGINGFTSAWFDLTSALTQIREGKIDEGLDSLNQMSLMNVRDWRIPANKARIMEGRRSIQAAIELYNEAAAMAGDPRDASQLQIRLSRCYEALGMPAESQKALEIAMELDSENLSARMEIYRMERLK